MCTKDNRAESKVWQGQMEGATGANIYRAQDGTDQDVSVICLLRWCRVRRACMSSDVRNPTGVALEPVGREVSVRALRGSRALDAVWEMSRGGGTQLLYCQSCQPMLLINGHGGSR